MSIRKKMICDKCGKEIPAFNNAEISRTSARIDLYPILSNRTYPTERIDLCEDCYEKFINFLEK